MSNTDFRNINIAVFRGGKNHHGISMKSGQNIISLFNKVGININDVYLDDDGNFIKNGTPSDKHAILSNVDGYIDTTGHYDSPYNDLAKRMGLRNLISHEDTLHVQTDRENIYRILRQAGILVPNTFVIRKTEKDLPKVAKEIWLKFHTPFLIRPLEHTSSEKSSLVKSFQDLVKVVSEYHDKGNDVHIISYKSVPTFSTAVLPNYRGEEYYTPLSIQTFVGKHEVPRHDSMTRVYIKADDNKKEQIKKVTENVSRILQPRAPICVDVIPHNDGYMVVNVDLAPSLHEDSRFMQSLATTGCDLGHYLAHGLANRK